MCSIHKHTNVGHRCGRPDSNCDISPDHQSSGPKEVLTSLKVLSKLQLFLMKKTFSLSNITCI